MHPGAVILIVDCISFLAHVDTCATTNTGKILLNKYIMTKNPSLIAEFIQYDDADPFDTIILQCTVTDLVKSENDHGNITAIVRYWTPYTFTDDKPVRLSFGIWAGVTVCSIIVLTKIRQWGCMLDLRNGKLISPAIEMVFLLMF